MRRLVVQESVVISGCRIMHNMMFWPQMSYYQGFFHVNFFLHTQWSYMSMKEHILLEKYAHNITQYHDEKKTKSMVMSSLYHTLQK
jgi:hypothetical protein